MFISSLLLVLAASIAFGEPVAAAPREVQRECERLASDDPEEAARAAFALASMARKTDAKGLLVSSREERLLIVETLIAHLCFNEAPRVRSACAVSLGTLGPDRETATALKTVLLSDDTRYVRKAAARALGMVGNLADVDALLKAAEDDTGHFPHGRDLAREARGAIRPIADRIGGERAADILIEVCGEEEAVIGSPVLFSHLWGTAAVCDWLEMQMANGGTIIEAWAVLGYEHRENQEILDRARSHLRGYLSSPDPRLRLRSVAGFFSIGRADDLPVLGAMLSDPHCREVTYVEGGETRRKTVYRVRERAEWAIAKTTSRLLRQAYQETPVPVVSDGWGKLGDGILQCRLGADRDIWRTTECPVVQVDIRNRGGAECTLEVRSMHFELFVDGKVYRRQGYDYITRSFVIRSGWQEIGIPLLLAGAWWQPEETTERAPVDDTLLLAPGEHTIQVRVNVRDLVPWQPVNAESNSIEIAIEPRDSPQSRGR
jgi:HEAT repeat protein